MFKVLIAASPSFINDDKLEDAISHYLSNKPCSELHCITLKHFTQSVKNAAAKFNHTVNIHVRDFFHEGHKTTQIIYQDLVNKCDAVLLFWDQESKNEAMLIKMCDELPRKKVVIKFESLKQEIDRLKKEGKVEKRKRITIPLSENAKIRYKAAHQKWQLRSAPQAVKDFGYNKTVYPIINAGSRMDFFIVNFLVWEGWSATKVSVLYKTGDKFIRTGAKPGTFDLTATIKGKSVKLETKHSSDKPSEQQLQMQIRERNAGAVAEFVYSIDEFFEIYDKILKGEI